MMSSTCTADGVCTNTEAIQPIALAPLPPIIRHDVLAYLNQRQGASELKSEPPLSPKQWHRKQDIFETQCTLYMAESSIPNAGLGIFAGKDFEVDELVDPAPQAVVPLIDIQRHTKYEGSVLANYPWASWTQGAQLEAKSIHILYPNLGMLANSHLGLANAENTNYCKIDIGSNNRTTDYRTGANTLYHSASFTVEGSRIAMGSEIFVDYGEGYFHHREEQFDIVFPTFANYEEADKIIRDFAKTLKDEITEEDEEAWDKLVTELEDDELKTRVAFALPEFVDDVAHVAEVGTARWSIPESIRSTEWLQEHGICLDNLRMGKSEIPYAGNGAFAMRSMKEGTIVAPMPLLPIMRDALEMRSDEEEGTYGNNQLLLNYCFGHRDSQLLFFPYSSSVHFINHRDDPNAEIRWSSHSLHKSENLDKKVKDVYTGLIMDVVALRDIGIGEEVTIDYGEAWNEAWDDHVNSWAVPDGVLGINPATVLEKLNEDLTKPIKTELEQKESPNPSCVRTACYSERYNGTYVTTEAKSPNLRFCNVTDRYRKGNEYWYDAKMGDSDHFPKEEASDDDVVNNIPRSAIKFVVDEYCSDIHLKNAFRHEMHVPDGIYPDLWLGLVEPKDENNKDAEEEEDKEAEEESIGTDEEHAAALIAWLEAEEGYFNPNLEMRRVDPADPNSRFGMFAKGDIQAKGLMLRIPDNMILHSGEEEPHLSAMNCETVRNLIKDLRLKDESEYAPYIKYLLDTQPPGQLPTAWSEAGKALLAKVLGNEEEDEYMLPPAYPFDWMDDWYNDCEGSDDPLEEYAALLVVQRSWDDILIPVYDTMSHRNGQWLNTESNHVHEGEDILVRAKRDIKAGEEIYTTYNHCEDCGGRLTTYGTPEILRDYGFVEQFPQSWIFDNIGVAFRVDEELDEAGEATGEYRLIEWIESEPDDDGMETLRALLEQLVGTKENVLASRDPEVPENEWNTISDYVNAMELALKIAIDAYDEEE